MLPVYADTESKEVKEKIEVNYTVEQTWAFPLSIKSIGDGEVTQGDVTVRNKTEGFLIPIDESRTFTITADYGAWLEKITLDGKDVMGEIKDGTLNISSAAHNQTLVVEFTEDGKHSYDTSTAADGTLSTMLPFIFPQTGDSTPIKLIAGVLILAIIILLLSFGVKRKRNWCSDNKNQEKTND